MAGRERLGGWEGEGEKKRRGKGGGEGGSFDLYVLHLSILQTIYRPSTHSSIHPSFIRWMTPKPSFHTCSAPVTEYEVVIQRPS